MKKKLAVGILSAVLLAGGATVAFGATDLAKLDELKSLTQQMFVIQKQIVDKEVEAGLRTAEQAETMKKFIDERQEVHEQAIAEGKVLGPGMGSKGMGIRSKVKMFSNGEPMTEEQIEAWDVAAKERLAAQVEAMQSNGKLTKEQIETWSKAEQAQLDVQKEAMKSGSFVPGAMGGMGKGMRGGHRGAWGGNLTPETTTTTPETAS
ncbi:DUF2680 domain-containing protein [Desulfosporosinus sp.]|uniref:DUF2680 domain-containing protein n=1 Tax=Desulfosporosinus sp. TaxID=157907 RepID=UPI0025C069E9|nr:DUF2680 domain-containing protein [Desulfosporosinus sp.]MBC2722120.1 DUF2680 domain-containing protein [Desulfosporosinus sp.]MBC2726481.1 DUF2680 domain-containing protein [Desulfosporosinus sp.]